MNGESIKTQQVGNDGWDSLATEFAGERNINGRTQKERTFSQMDLYPRMKGETPEQYGARLKFMNQETAKYQEEQARIEEEERARQEQIAYENSEQGQREAMAQEKYDRLKAKLDQAVEEGRMTKEHADSLLERQLKQATGDIEAARQDYQDRQTVGSEEDQANYSEWLSRHDAENIANLEMTGRETATDEERARLEAEERAKLEAEEAAKEQAEQEESEQPPEESDEANSGDDAESDIGLDSDVVDKLKSKITKEKINRINEIDERLKNMLPDLAELYARNRRLFVGAKNRADFANAKSEFEKLLDERLRLGAEMEYESGKGEISEILQNRIEELRAEIEAKMAEFTEEGEKTSEETEAKRAQLIEEANNTIRSEYSELVKELESKVNANFLAHFLESQAKLEDATIDALDNGSFCRSFVNKVINNKVLKGALIAASVVGLAATGVGLATGLAAGSMAVSLGYTAGGVALGAGKGALAGGLMSRQDSKNSAVRGFATEEEIKSQLKDIDITNQDADTSNVTSWLMEQYSSANEADASSNRKRTAVAVGIGAALGGIMSGVHVDNVTTKEVTERVRVGTEPTKYEPTMFDKVNIPKGHGAYDTFTQMGGNPEDLQKALDIMHSIDSKYGMVPGSNGETAGLNGAVGDFAHTYPGPINTWPDVAQSYIREVAQEWARQGLIPSTSTGGGPIYDTITKTVTDYIPNAFMNFLTRATTLTTAAAVGGVAGGTREENTPRGSNVEQEEPTTQETPIIPEPPEIPGAPVFPEAEVATESEPITGDGIELPEVPEEQVVPIPEIETPVVEPVAEVSAEAIDSSDVDNKTEEIIRIMAERGLSPEGESGPEEISAEDADSVLERMRREMEARGIMNPDESPTSEETPDSIIESIDADLRDRIGEEGIQIMVSQEESGVDSSSRIANWWNSLDDATKRDVVQFEASADASSVYGRALRIWLQLNGQINS